MRGEKKEKTIQQKFGMLPASFTCHVIVNLCSADGIAAPHPDETLLMSPGGPIQAPVTGSTWNKTPRTPPSSKRCHVLLSIFSPPLLLGYSFIAPVHPLLLPPVWLLLWGQRWQHNKASGRTHTHTHAWVHTAFN